MDTAQKQGRLSFNPLKHIDPFGTILLPLMLWIAHAGIILGWAKPVPVDFSNLKHPRKGMFWVSAAGIIMNIWLAIISALLMLLIPFVHSPYMQMVLNLFFLNMIVYNIVIALFNALPIPPLDGSKIFFGWINKPWAVKYINSGKPDWQSCFSGFHSAGNRTGIWLELESIPPLYYWLYPFFNFPFGIGCRYGTADFSSNAFSFIHTSGG